MTTFGYDSFFFCLEIRREKQIRDMRENTLMSFAHGPQNPPADWLCKSAPLTSLLKPVFSPQFSYLSFLHKHPSRWSFTMPTAWRKE